MNITELANRIANLHYPDIPKTRGDKMFRRQRVIELQKLVESELKNCSILDVSESTLGIPDIRNKLSPITHLITIIEDERFDKEKWLPKALDGAKRSVNYLAQRDVYSR